MIYKNKIALMALCINMVITAAASCAKAQKVDPNKFLLSIGAEGGSVTGYEHTYRNVEFGGTARLQYGIADKFTLSFVTGYYSLLGKSFSYDDPRYIYSPIYNGIITTTTSNFGIIPIKLGIRGYIYKHIFMMAEAGLGIETDRAPPSDNYDLVEYGQDKLILSPGLGYASKNFEIGLRYECFTGKNSVDGLSHNFGIGGLHLAYVLPHD